MNKRVRGFTLVELIIAISVFAILAVVGFISIFNYKQIQQIDLVTQEIIAVLRNSQNRSISQESGSRWGVYFENSSSVDFYELFMGTSYAGGTVYARSVLPSGVQFEIPAAGSNSSIVFSPITGLPANSAIIKISLVGSPTTSSTININSNGEIQY